MDENLYWMSHCLASSSERGTLEQKATDNHSGAGVRRFRWLAWLFHLHEGEPGKADGLAHEICIDMSLKFKDFLCGAKVETACESPRFAATPRQIMTHSCK